MIAPRPRGHSLWYHIFEFTFGLLQGWSAKIQALRILKGLPVSHFIWAVAMGLAGIAMVVAYKKLTRCRWREALKLGVSLILIRFITFTPWLNRLRGKSWFYVGKGSFQDRLMAKCYIWFWSAAVILFTFFQF